jgi:surface antigen
MKSRTRKRVLRYFLAVSQIILLAAVAKVLLHSADAEPSQLAAVPILNQKSEDTGAPLDHLTSADIAVQVAKAANMREATATTNTADSMSVKTEALSDGDSMAPKPQVVSTDLKTRKDIKKYITKAGDTVGSLAIEFGITSDTIRWSNSLGHADELPAGKELTISPVNGLTYTVKTGDTPETLATKYRTSKDKIISFNDAEISGLAPNELIVIPDGSIAPPPPVSIASGLGSGFAWGGNAPIYSNNVSNGYDYGQCTWWVAIRRQQIGRPVPSNLGNANTWTSLAARAGIATGSTPEVGAVIWTDPSTMNSFYRIYGHVGIVEKINDDGSVWVSDMNSSGYTQMDIDSGRGGGWNKTSYRLLSPEKARSFTYIY